MAIPVCKSHARTLHWLNQKSVVDTVIATVERARREPGCEEIAVNVQLASSLRAPLIVELIKRCRFSPSVAAQDVLVLVINDDAYPISFSQELLTEGVFIRVRYQEHRILDL